MLLETLFFKKHLERGEKILFAAHRHWVLLIRPGLATGFFGFLIPWSLYWAGLNTELFFLISIFWSLAAYMFFMYRLFKWHANAILVTSMGILKVDWQGFFSNVASRVPYEEIEGAGYEIKGFWPTVLRYGNFTVSLLSGKVFLLTIAARPARAELMVMKLLEAYMLEKNKRDVAGLKSLLSDLAVYHLKHKKE